MSNNTLPNNETEVIANKSVEICSYK